MARLCEDAGVEVRALVGACGDEEAAVRAALDGEGGRGGVVLGDEVLRARLEVIKDVLLTQQRAVVAPLPAVLAAAADVGHREAAVVRREPRKPAPATALVSTHAF